MPADAKKHLNSRLGGLFNYVSVDNARHSKRDVDYVQLFLSVKKQILIKERKSKLAKL